MGLKILHSADWHLESPFAGFPDRQKEFLRAEQRRIPGMVTELAEKENCDLILLSGDIFDGKATPETLEATKARQTDAAVLTAVNLADELFKEQASSEALRVQIQQALSEAGQAQNEVSELKREVFRLQQRLDNRNGNGNKR